MIDVRIEEIAREMLAAKDREAMRAVRERYES